MDKYKLYTVHKHFLADTVTPVSIYLQLRDKYRNCIMLESSDYHGHENSFSYICCEPIGGFELKDQVINQFFPVHVSGQMFDQLFIDHNVFFKKHPLLIKVIRCRIFMPSHINGL